MIKLSKRTQKSIWNILIYAVLVLFTFVIDLPILSMLGTSVKTKAEALSSLSLFPARPSLENFENVIFETTFLRNVLNSLIVAITVSIACIIISSFAAYAISRFKGKIFSFYMSMLLILQMFPGVLLMIPMFVIFKSLNLINNLFSIIISYSAINLPFSIWMLKGFFDTIPYELEEAASIDGYTQFKCFQKIILPLSGPGLETVGIFTFVNCWNEYMLSSVFIRSDELQTITVGLQRFVQQHSTDWASMMAASTIAIIPSLIFLVFAQKYLVQGLTAGAVKG